MFYLMHMSTNYVFVIYISLQNEQTLLDNDMNVEIILYLISTAKSCCDIVSIDDRPHNMFISFAMMKSIK